MNKHLRYLVIAAAALLLALGAFLLGHSSRSRSELQSFKASLRAQGEKLTLQELTQFRPTNSDDGSSLATLMDAVASIGSVRLHPATLEVRKFVGPGQALLSWRATH